MICENWDYEEKGPDFWFTEYATCGYGSMQSPINIQTTNLQYSSSLKPFTFIDYNQNITFNITNNGETGNFHFSNEFC